MPAPATPDRFAAVMGKKVRVHTRAFRHVVGRLEAWRGGRLIVRVAANEVLIDPASVVAIDEAFPEEAEFVK